MSKHVLKMSLAGDLRRFMVELPVDETTAYAEIVKAIVLGFALSSAQAFALEGALTYKDDEGDVCNLIPSTIPDLMLLSAGGPLRLFAESLPLDASSDDGASSAQQAQSWRPSQAGAELPKACDESAPPLAQIVQHFLAGLVTGDSFAAVLLHFGPLFASQLDAHHEALDSLADDHKDAALMFVQMLREGVELFPQFSKVQVALDNLLQTSQVNGLGLTLAALLRALSEVPKEQLHAIAVVLAGIAERVAQEFPSILPPTSLSPGDLQPPVHAHVACDGCGTSPIVGPRFKCVTCLNYDLCGKCYLQKGELHPLHTFECFVHPVSVSHCKGWHKGCNNGWHKGLSKGVDHCFLKGMGHWFLKGKGKGKCKGKDKGKGKGKKGWRHSHPEHHSSDAATESACKGAHSSTSTASESSTPSTETCMRERKVEKHAARAHARAARQVCKAARKEAKKSYKLQVKAAKQAWKQEKKALKLQQRAHTASGTSPSNAEMEMDEVPTAWADAAPEDNALQMLAEMGFQNIELNCQLLEQHEGNAQAALEVLLGGGKFV